jgi:stearoyl-CoA desaturase (delta-9 desaturase)
MTSTQHLKVFCFALSILCMFYFDITLFILSVLFGWILSGTAVSALYHRKISHRSFEYKNKVAEYFSYFLMLISGQGTPLGWAIIHRTHHAKTDTLQDPQSPHSVGKFKTLISWYHINDVNPKIIIDILRDKKLMMLHNHYNKMFVSYTLILFLINPLFCLYFAGLSVTVCALFLGIVNTFGHSDLTNQDGTYASNIALPWILWGEENHKDHHTNPSSFKISKTDWGSMFIRLIGNPKV